MRSNSLSATVSAAGASSTGAGVSSGLDSSLASVFSSFFSASSFLPKTPNRLARLRERERLLASTSGAGVAAASPSGSSLATSLPLSSVFLMAAGPTVGLAVGISQQELKLSSHDITYSASPAQPCSLRSRGERPSQPCPQQTWPRWQRTTSHARWSWWPGKRACGRSI